MDAAGMSSLRVRPPQLPGIELESVIGRGGMSVVWKGFDSGLGRPVAVKVLQRDFSCDERDLARFRKEAETMTRIRHPGIVRGYGMYRSRDGLYYVVMELVSGYDLGQLVSRKTRLPESDALIVAESVAVAMEYAWNGYRMVHCDIKPENIMVDSDGTVKLTDLGLCRTFSALSSGAGGEDEIVGTPAYISPEQIEGRTDLDCRADIYSLGATLYHLVSGRTLFVKEDNDGMLRAHLDPESCAPDPRHWAHSISQGFATLLENMLVKDRDCRIGGWGETLAAVRAIIDGRAECEDALSRPVSPSSVRNDWV